MGLDMFVYAKKTDLADDVQVDFDIDYDWDRDEICYWRKHPNLHGWMFDLYLQKGGQSSEGFNGDTLRLNHEDVNALEKAIIDDELPNTSGFFFGHSPQKDDDYYEQAKSNDFECVKKIRDALDAGLTVWYNSSW